jgi:predicted MFS family arabinose efflux permease
MLRALALPAAMATFFGNFFWPLYSLYGLRELGLTPAALGGLIGLGGVGGIAGALAAGWAARRFGIGPAIVGSQMLASVIGFLTPLAGGPPWLIMLCLGIPQLLGDGAMTVSAVSGVSLRQTLAPSHLLGRVNASMAVIVGGLGPLGTLAGGLLGQVLGVRLTLLVAVLGIFVASLWLLASPVRRMRETSAALA